VIRFRGGIDILLREDNIWGDAEERVSWVVGCRCVLECYAEVYRAAAEMDRFQAIELDRLEVDERRECVGGQVWDLHFRRGEVGAEVGEARWGEAVTSRVDGCVKVQFGILR
jgi:ABC-type antimicrobial peptide transport system ATPase subunit